MPVVSNTSPISNLAIVDRLALLRRRYQSVIIPSAVATELEALTHPAAKERVRAAIADGWLQIDTTIPQEIPLPFPLDLGEAAAIRMALAQKADVILLDERKARIAARQLGLSVAGVLGELLHAKSAGVVSAVRPELQRLRSEAGFYIDEEIERFILDQSGE